METQLSFGMEGGGSDSSPEPDEIRSRIKGMLADGPRPASEIMILVGCSVGDLRKAIQGWGDLVSETSWGMTLWLLQRTC